jgi:predicted NBD/HSP70 family sugar kinase
MSASKEICAIVPSRQKGYQPIVYGMGFLVSDQQILTCAHVVEAALGSDWQQGAGTVQVCFPFVETDEGVLILQGHVDRERWFARGTPTNKKPTDIAVIVLDVAAPGSVKRATLLHASFEPDVMVKIYGFAGLTAAGGYVISHPTGQYVEGKTMGALPGGRAQFQGTWTTGTVVQSGFSGAGVYDPQRDSIVGMVVRASANPAESIAEFIGTPSLRLALGPAAVPAGVLSVGPTQSIPRSLYDRIIQKRQDAESYLKEIGDILPEPDPDNGLKGLLESVFSDSPDAARLRVAFGFGTQDLRPVFNLMKEDNPAVQSLWGKWAQRLDQALWRYGHTLDYVDAAWANPFHQRAQEWRTICEPYRPARQPTLDDIAAILSHGSQSMSAFIEYTPDAELYAVMRSFPSPGASAGSDLVGTAEPNSGPALDFILDYLGSLKNGTRSIDDSANAWWAVRIGICRNDDRFREALAFVADKFAEPRVPQEQAANNPMPEIYKPVSTVAYTLSNAQAILECGCASNDVTKNRLHEVIAKMRDRLLATPISRNLYLASVHQEGLRNYLDYSQDQKITVGV